MLFEKDPRGCPVHMEKIRLNIEFSYDIPVPHKPSKDWLINETNKTITVTKIREVDWQRNGKGLNGIFLIADLWYWSDENGALPPPSRKPKLKLIKGEGN